MPPEFTLTPRRIKTVRPFWYRNVTFRIGHDHAHYDMAEMKPVSGFVVDLVLPNGKTRPVGFFAEETHVGMIRDAAAEVFRNSWDPDKDCEKQLELFTDTAKK